MQATTAQPSRLVRGSLSFRKRTSILEDSYNTLHVGAGDDSELGGVTYRGAGGVAGTGRDESNVDRRKGAGTCMGYEGDYECGPLYPNDDDAALTVFLGSGGPLSVHGRLSLLAVVMPWTATQPKLFRGTGRSIIIHNSLVYLPRGHGKPTSRNIHC
jgi:hypothetical protein